MENLNLALKNYFEILEGKNKSKFKRVKKLDNKIKEAFKILENCELCERKCKVNRLKKQLGWCKVGDEIEISSYFTHLGEEYFLIPSFTIFFISCTFACQYCQNWSISQRFEKGKIIKEKELAKIINKHNHCKNINFVGGDPTPYLPFILKILKSVKIDLPIVWNSNFYMSEKSMSLLKDVIDIYLSDFKYGNDNCAKRLSKVSNYTEVIKRNHLLAAKNAELVIRHLVLPNHFECCTKPILKWIKDNLGNRVIVNLMDQYRPCWNAFKYKDINRHITVEEFKRAKKYAEELGLNFVT